MPPFDAGTADANARSRARSPRVIVFVWDGLRPDSVNPEDTPHLAELLQSGSQFADNHSTYPTYTMLNAASFATGATAETTGFYANWVWQPEVVRRSASGDSLLTDGGAPVRYEQPVFNEEYTVVRDFDDFYGGDLLAVGTLFEAVRARGWTTAVVGKTGPAYLQDRHQHGSVLDERAAWPLSFARDLQAAGVRLPKTTSLVYRPDDILLDPAANGDPTAVPPSKRLADGQTTDPTDTSAVPAQDDADYLMSAYADFVLPKKQPDLSVVWIRNPDTAEHWYGPGSPTVKQALHHMDALLGKLLDKLTTLGWREATDMIVVSDHGHSTVSGRLDLFPPRAIVQGKQPGQARVGGVDPHGFSVSGDVRLADLLSRIGKFHAYDGLGCLFDPVLSGITADGKALYPVRTDDEAGTMCGKDPKTGHAGLKYNTPPYRLPNPLPMDAVVVALNGGSDYVYVPSHAQSLVERVVRFLQAREEAGAIFVSSRYAPIAGTLPMSAVGIEYPDRRRNPDLVVAYDYDEHASIAGELGITYAGAQNHRGMHGNLSPADVRNTFIASGPSFRRGFVDPLPTGNIDLAPTIANIFGTALPGARGRILHEALTVSGASLESYRVEDSEPIQSSPATGLRMFLPTDTDGRRLDPTKSQYRILLKTRTVVRANQRTTYYDWAKAIRQ